jgi:hypothetical protein
MFGLHGNLRKEAMLPSMKDNSGIAALFLDLRPFLEDFRLMAGGK